MKVIRLWISVAICTAILFSLGSAGVQSEDQEFVLKAAEGGMLEVELGNLAAKNASSPKVKEYGKMMVKDHSKVNQELMQLAGKKKINVPTALSTAGKQQLDSLSSQQGEKFDLLYMNMMIASHEQTIGLFQTESNKGQDKELKSWADSKIPALKKHLEHAKTLFPAASQAR